MLLNHHPHWQLLNIRQAEAVEHISTYTHLDELLILAPQNCSLTHFPKNIRSIVVGNSPENAKNNYDLCSQELSAIRPESVSCILVSLGFIPENTQNFLAQIRLALKPNGLAIIVSCNDPCFAWRLSSSYLRKVYKQCLHNRHKIIHQSKIENLEFIENLSFSMSHPWITHNFPIIVSRVDSACLHLPLALGQFNATILQKKQTAGIPQNKLKFKNLKQKAILSSVTKKIFMEKLTLYTDGGSRGNPGLGGWGCILECKEKGVSEELFGNEELTTNNRMELTAVIEGLQRLNKKTCQVEIVSDSRYVCQGLKEWLPQWIKRGWKTAARKKVKNIDLWEQLSNLASRHKISCVWVKGHAGHPMNERADKLANQAMDELSNPK